MKSITLVLLIASCIIIGTNGAGTIEAPTEAEKKCINDAGQACADFNVKECKDAVQTHALCQVKNCASITNITEFYGCVNENCHSDYASVQTYYDKIWSCLNGPILSLSVGILFILSFLF